MEILFKMMLPDGCENIIKLQRSNYGKKNIKRKYNEDIENEFNQIIPFLPESCNTILDIGCGLAGMSILMYHYYDHPLLYLVDKDLISKKIKYGFSENESFYNSHEILQKILEMNCIENFVMKNPDDDFKDLQKIDIAVSFLACGFHFPLYYYFGRIFNNLSETGIFICDIRKTQSDQIKMINLYFDNVKEIETDNPKTIRICAKEAKCQA